MSSKPFGKPFEKIKEKSVVQVLVMAINEKESTSKNWVKILVDFTPDKYWNYLSIGLNRSVFDYKQYSYSMQNNILKNRRKTGECYYYLDNIQLIDLSYK